MIQILESIPSHLYSGMKENIKRTIFIDIIAKISRVDDRQMFQQMEIIKENFYSWLTFFVDIT